MKRDAKRLKTSVIAVMIAASAVLTGCGEKEYLDEIKAKSYVKLGEYKGIEVVQAEPEITEEDRDSYMDYLLSLNPDRGVIEGDTVNIDYVGTLDGVAFDGGTASGQDLTIGSGRFIDGFEDGLIGAKVGDTVELNLTFPEDYHAEDMAGKEVVFTVTVNTIFAAQPQELTDAYVQKLDIGYTTAEEYKQYVYDMLYQDAMESYESSIENEVISVVLENCEFKKELPEKMINRYAETLTANLTAEAERYGATLEQFMMAYYGMDEETYKEEIRKQASKSAQQYVVLQAIADKENLNITDEELQSEMEKMAEQAEYESVDEFKELVNDKDYKEYMMGQKVLDMLRENAVVTAE